MTREEEIRQASIEYTMENAPKCIGGDAFSEVMDGMNRNHAFEEGAKWADKTMIEKAYKWAKENFECYVGADVSEYYIYVDDFVEDFRKAMEK